MTDEQFLRVLHGSGIVKYRFAVHDAHLFFLRGCGRRLHCYKKVHFLHLRVSWVLLFRAVTLRSAEVEGQAMQPFTLWECNDRSSVYIFL